MWRRDADQSVPEERVEGVRQMAQDGEVTVVGQGARLEGTIVSAGSLRIDGHFVVSGGFDLSDDRTRPESDLRTRVPRQRWAYVGGPGSVPTLALLQFGGDQLVYVDGRYNIPIEQLKLPFVGPPIVTLREILAGADVGTFPSISQSMGVRLAASVIYVDFMFDPDTRYSKFGVGLSFAR